MSPIGKKKCSYSPMQEKGLISPSLAIGNIKEPKYTTVENEDGTETNTLVKTKKHGKNKGEVKKTTISLVGFNPSGEKVGLASITSKPGKTDKTSGSRKDLASLKNSIKKPITKKGLISPTPKTGGVEEVDTNSFEEKPLDPAESTTVKNEPYTGPMTFELKTKPKYFKKSNSRNKTQRTRR